MKREMGQIGRVVRDFIRHYREHGVNDDNIVKFTGELEGIGETLTDRIEREETSLYTLYMPPENFA